MRFNAVRRRGVHNLSPFNRTAPGIAIIRYAERGTSCTSYVPLYARRSGPRRPPRGARRGIVYTAVTRASVPGRSPAIARDRGSGSSRASGSIPSLGIGSVPSHAQSRAGPEPRGFAVCVTSNQNHLSEGCTPR